MGKQWRDEGGTALAAGKTRNVIDQPHATIDGLRHAPHNCTLSLLDCRPAHSLRSLQSATSTANNSFEIMLAFCSKFYWNMRIRRTDLSVPNVISAIHCQRPIRA
jgi:hypothetical protein